MKTIIYLSFAILFASCATYQRIGQFTMVSTRNIDSSKEYSLIQKDVEATVTTTNNTDALQDCIDKAVAKVPDGEYMMNVKISMMTDGSKLKVIGDVYGIPSVKVDVQTNVTVTINFNVGDEVLADKKGKIIEGKIIGIYESGAVVEYLTDSGRLFKEKFTFDKLTKKN